jgi:hypothetical protein
MKTKAKFLVLWLLVMVIVGVVVAHLGGHFRFVLEHCLAYFADAVPVSTSIGCF